MGVIKNVRVFRNLTNIVISEYGLQLLNYDIIFRQHARLVKIENLDTVQAAGVFWINFSRVYNIAFREGDTLAETRHRAISEGTDPEEINTTVYNPEDWELEDKCIEPSTNEHSTVAVLIDGKEELRIIAMISEEDYFFLAAKNNGDHFILNDNGAGVTCFNLLRLHDAID